MGINYSKGELWHHWTYKQFMSLIQHWWLAIYSLGWSNPNGGTVILPSPRGCLDVLDTLRFAEKHGNWAVDFSQPTSKMLTSFDDQVCSNYLLHDRETSPFTAPANVQNDVKRSEQFTGTMLGLNDAKFNATNFLRSSFWGNETSAVPLPHPSHNQDQSFLSHEENCTSVQNIEYKPPMPKSNWVDEQGNSKMMNIKNASLPVNHEAIQLCNVFQNPHHPSLPIMVNGSNMNENTTIANNYEEPPMWRNNLGEEYSRYHQPPGTYDLEPPNIRPKALMNDFSEVSSAFSSWFDNTPFDHIREFSISTSRTHARHNDNCFI